MVFRWLGLRLVHQLTLMTIGLNGPTALSAVGARDRGCPVT
jgi:hypothetical protein